MNRKFFTSEFLILFVFVFFSACSTLRDSGVPAPEMDTTETGIATGAVLGAGMGAVIGATAGQVGAGAVVGGIAGGATGGVIGKALETNEKRLDAHDQKLGMDTRPTGGASIRSRIWAPADELAYADNRPSGTRGVAAKYVSPADSGVVIKSEEKRRVPVDPSTLSRKPETHHRKQAPQQVTQIHRDTGSRMNDIRSSETYTSRGAQASDYTEGALPRARQASGGTASAPRIELQKPRPELPLAQNPPPVRTPGSGERAASVSRAGSTSAPSRSEQGRAMLAEPKKQTLPQNVSSPARKTAKQDIHVPAACDKGKNEIARAKNAASDSDKVFYLRRAILACPEDPSIRVELGKVYSRLGLKDDARKEFTKALDFDPSNESAQDELSIMMLDSHAN
jgi:hypothetical protein